MGPWGEGGGVLESLGQWSLAVDDFGKESMEPGLLESIKQEAEQANKNSHKKLLFAIGTSF